jgi:hypothetical protein
MIADKNLFSLNLEYKRAVKNPENPPAIVATRIDR